MTIEFPSSAATAGPSYQTEVSNTYNILDKLGLRKTTPKKLYRKLVTAAKKDPSQTEVLIRTVLYRPGVGKYALQDGLTVTEYNPKQGTGTIHFFPSNPDSL